MSGRVCTVMLLRFTEYQPCGEPVGPDGRCAAGHDEAAGHVGAQGVERSGAPLPPPERHHQGAARYKLFSADDHIVEPADLWSSRVPRRWREAAPHVVREGDQEFWAFEDTRAQTIGLNAVAGKPRDQWNMDPLRFDDMIPGCYVAAERARDMADDGVMSSVCFPTLPRFGGALFSSFRDKDLADVCVKAYNDFIFDEWCAAAPQMFVPMPIVQLWDPVLAAADVRRNVERGARAICMPEETSLLGLPSYYDASWDPIWEAVVETDIAVCMHIGSSGWAPFQPPGAPYSLTIALGNVGAQQHAVALMMSPIPRKFPTIKLVISEGGIGWVPAALERADRHYERQRHWAGGDDLLPSEVARRNIWWCMIEEPWGIGVRHVVGVEHVLWECDYPHTDTTWPNSQSTSADILDMVPRDEAEMIAHRNAERLFDWRCPEPGELEIHDRVPAPGPPS